MLQLARLSQINQVHLFLTIFPILEADLRFGINFIDVLESLLNSLVAYSSYLAIYILYMVWLLHLLLT